MQWQERVAMGGRSGKWMVEECVKGLKQEKLLTKDEEEEDNVGI